MPHNFGPAVEDETIVYGASRPGYPSKRVGNDSIWEWIDFMRNRSIGRICCLLSERQLSLYPCVDLLAMYREQFGEPNVCWVPVKDYHLVDTEALAETILPFFRESASQGVPVVVHCSGGIGRTGHILASWLVFDRGIRVDDALRAVVGVSGVNRDPWEAVSCGNATEQDLRELLQQ